MDDLLTPAEAAEYLRLSKHTLDMWRLEPGKGPPWIRMGESSSSRVFYRRDDIDKWVDDHKSDAR